jgi:predicted RNA-binding protein with PIN domain
VVSEGWIKLHRSLLEWEWYDDINTMRLFIHLILKANHKPKKYKGIEIKMGEIVTGLSILSKETSLSMQRIRTSLSRLKSTNEITIKTSSQGSIIQIVNYCKYQTTTNNLTNEQQTTNKQLTTNKNEKNEKKERNIIPPMFEMIEKYAKTRGLKVDIIRFFNHYESNGWMVGKNKMKDWQASYRTWEPKKVVSTPKFVR